MNKKIILLSVLLSVLIISPSANAARTPSCNLNGVAEETKCVCVNGGNINSTINCETGALESAFTPGFRITTNSRGDKELAMTIAANTQSGMTNAVFTSGMLHYVVLTNADALPPASSVANIRTGTPTATLNSNAIAYNIIDPPNQIGVLQTEYISSGDFWRLHLSKKGPVDTYITVPAALPFTNTYSGDDEAGRYQAVVTLTFE